MQKARGNGNPFREHKSPVAICSSCFAFAPSFSLRTKGPRRSSKRSVAPSYVPAPVPLARRPSAATTAPAEGGEAPDTPGEAQGSRMRALPSLPEREGGAQKKEWGPTLGLGADCLSHWIDCVGGISSAFGRSCRAVLGSRLVIIEWKLCGDVK